MRDHSIENRYAPNPRSASSAMSSGKRQKWSHASPDGSAHPEPGVCSHSHQSLFQLSPSTWCAAVAVPQRKPSGNEIAMGRDARRPYTRQRMGVLDEILAAKRAELALLQESEARNTPRRAALDAAPSRDFAGALRRPDGRLAVVAEIKRRSPSKGDLAPDLDPAAAAKAYESGGAAALSVLTDRPFFGGSVDDLQTARAKVEIPALRKDFVIDETQVYEARAIGADAVLLIVAALDDDGLLAGLRELAEEIGIVALVEAHDDAELDRALAAGATVIGVNARDLGTFGEDLGLSERLADRIPGEVTAVAESAIRAPEDAERMADAGYDAVLVGEALVRSDDPTELVDAMSRHSVRPRR